MKLEKQTFDHFYREIIDRYADNPCVGFVNGTPLTYRSFDEQVSRLRAVLTEIGIQKGDKVVLLGDSSPNWAAAFFSVITSGAIVVPILPDFPEADISHIVRHSEATSAFCSEKIFSAMMIPAMERMSFVFSLTDFLPISTSQTESKKTQKMGKKLQVVLSLLKSEMIPEPEPSPDISEDDLAEILYTSGTTGHSKGVMLTHRNLVTNALAGAEAAAVVNEDSVVLSLLPLAHAYGSTCSMLTAMSVGASVYFLDKKPSPKILMAALATLRPHILAGVPLIFEKIFHKQILPELTGNRLTKLIIKSELGRKLLYRLAGKKVLRTFGGRLDCAVIGGASLNNEVETFMREGNIPYTIGYGLSECSPLVSGSPVIETKIGSVGKAVRDVKIRIDNPDPETGVGEILVKGPNVMKGYYKNEQANADVFTKDNWLHTGDRGFLDEDGYLFIRGRSKNVIVGPSGENIYPEVIEDKLKESLYVEESLVYEKDGKLVARIYLDYEYVSRTHSKDHDHITPEIITTVLEKIRTAVNQKLPQFSQINQVLEQTEPFEKTPTNKVKRQLYINY